MTKMNSNLAARMLEVRATRMTTKARAMRMTAVLWMSILPTMNLNMIRLTQLDIVMQK